MGFPPKFTRKDGSTAVLVEITHADYRVEIYAVRGAARVRSLLNVRLPVAGHPVFDLVPDPTAVHVRPLTLGVTTRGRRVQIELERFGGEDGARSRCRVVQERLEAGEYELEIEHDWPDDTYDPAAGLFAFSMSDEQDRGFLEQWLPTGFEHNAYPATLRVAIDAPGHRLWANGQVEERDGSWLISFPKHYTCSSFFVLLADTTKHIEQFVRVAGTDFVVVGARSSVDTVVGQLKGRGDAIIASLEKTFDRKLPSPMLLHAVEDDAMEYAGAAQVNDLPYALWHELAHQYVGRHVMPASGRTAWFDEAVAEWLRHGMQPAAIEPDALTALSGDAWQRHTSRSGYEHGHQLVRYLHHLLGDDFVRALRELVAHGPRIVSNDSLRAELTTLAPAHAQAVEELWQRHVDGKETSTSRPSRPSGLSAFVRETLKSAEEQRKFYEDPEGHAGEYVGERLVPIVMSLDPDLITAFARVEEALRDEDADDLRSATAARTRRNPYEARGRRERGGGKRRFKVMRAGGAGWPHPRPTFRKLEPEHGESGATLPQFTVHGDGLMDGAVVRLVQQSGGVVREYVGRVATGTPYTDRKLVVEPMPLTDELHRGLPPGRYRVEVINRPGLPAIRSSCAFEVLAAKVLAPETDCE